LINIAAYTYSIAALAFLSLGAFSLMSGRSRRHAPLLTVASLVTACWAASLAWEATRFTAMPALTGTLGLLRSGVWTVFLVILIGNFKKENSPLPFRLQPSLALVAVGYLVLLVLVASGAWGSELLSSVGLVPGVTSNVGISVLGMLLVEQLYRNTHEQGRWAIKFACLGIGAMFVFDFYVYSDAMLFREINGDIWAARGIVNALIAPLIGVAIARSATWSSALAVSRRVVFHSVALFGSAIYLLAMGLAGYYLRYLGGNWGTVMQVTFLFGALILLGAMLFSGALRSRLKVFISKHFYRYNYDYREEWLRFTRALSEHGPGLASRSIETVAGLVESPGGALWIRRDSGRFEPSANWRFPPVPVSEPADSPFCHYLETKQWVVDLEEYRREPEKYDDIDVPAWLREVPRGRLVLPLITHGRLFGFMLLLEPRSSIVLNWEVIDLLKIAGTQAASYLAQQDAAMALMVARQFESFNRMSTFVVHDLKNLVSQLSLMMRNAEKHRDNPEFQRDMIDTVNFSVQKMRLLLQKLSRSESPEHIAPLSLARLVKQAVALKAAYEPMPVLRIADAGLQVVADAERLERVIGHLIQNAIEATPADGSVQVDLERRDGAVLIRIADSGEGMSEEFIRERLFKPFDSTKSAGMGIGVFESREYIQELGGQLEVSSRPRVGTTFTILLPLYTAETQLADSAA
jgi:putative PEP-CTERM system histidine kinase